MAKKPETESILDMFSKFGSDMKLPKVDVEAVLSHHRKNLEALEKSARASRRRRLLADRQAARGAAGDA